MALSDKPGKAWPDYAAVWRWHFYAGLLCIPFVLWLAVTGSIYLFKPQVEAWLDAPYDHLAISGAPAAVSAQVEAARAAVPGSHLSAYQMPQEDGATRILLSRGDEVLRVYVHPQSLEVLKIVNEDERFMNQISFLHGELAMRDGGSLIVELAACWAIIMLLTGIYLWWPRSMSGVGGVLIPRVGAGPRLFWRDLHAVTGIWVCGAALFLLLTGLPWAKNWGGYLREVREVTGTLEGPQDWSTGRSTEIAQRRALAGGIEEDHSAHNHGAEAPIASDSAPLDQLVPLTRALALAPPVLITPPRVAGGYWVAKSDAQNRTLRDTYELDPVNGVTIGRRPFAARHPIDQAIGIGISAHEGALFGWVNLLLSLSAALGLILLCVSAIVLWLRRRPRDTLGAPTPRARPRFSFALLACIALLALLFPLFGASLALVWSAERVVLRRVAPVRSWLGLAA